MFLGVKFFFGRKCGVNYSTPENNIFEQEKRKKKFRPFWAEGRWWKGGVGVATTQWNKVFVQYLPKQVTRDVLSHYLDRA